MSEKTNIQWTDATWNVARGCTKVDSDCRYCYMYRDSFDSTRYDPLNVVRTKTVFDFPLKYKETKSKCWDGPPLIFTSSLTDFFHEAIDSYRDEAWDIIRKCPHLTFQILTKRPERIKEHLPADWGQGWDNVWLGTSVGSQEGIQRAKDIGALRGIAKVLFLSIEPIHGYVDLREFYFSHMITRHVPFSERTRVIDMFDWVIVGGESGNETGKYRYRPCEITWIESIIEQCRASNVPVFVKQMGTYLARQMKLKDRHGGDINEWPANLQVREWPPNS